MENEIYKANDFIYIKEFLVEPLEDIKVSKEITEPVPTGNKDENGIEEYDVKTEVKEVPSSFRKGKLVGLPFDYDGSLHKGDIVIYPKKFAIDFDIVENTQLVKPYDIIAVLNS